MTHDDERDFAEEAANAEHMRVEHEDADDPGRIDKPNKSDIEELSSLMDFDHVIEVHDDGTVTDAAPGIYAPELHGEEFTGFTDWRLLSGYTGQYGYNGPVMHPSEFVGGRLAQDILTTPGLYVALVVEDRRPCEWFVNNATVPAWCCNTHMYDGTGDFPATDNHPDECPFSEEQEPAGWAVAFRDTSE